MTLEKGKESGAGLGLVMSSLEGLPAENLTLTLRARVQLHCQNALLGPSGRPAQGKKNLRFSLHTRSDIRCLPMRLYNP